MNLTLCLQIREELRAPVLGDGAVHGERRVVLQHQGRRGATPEPADVGRPEPGGHRRSRCRRGHEVPAADAGSRCRVADREVGWSGGGQDVANH